MRIYYLLQAPRYSHPSEMLYRATTCVGKPCIQWVSSQRQCVQPFSCPLSILLTPVTALLPCCDMPSHKTLHTKWDKFRGHSSSPEPRGGQEQVPRSKSTLPPTTTADCVPSQSVIELTIEQTWPYPVTTSRDIPHAPTESPSSSAEVVITEAPTGGYPYYTASNPQDITTASPTASTDIAPYERGNGPRGHMKTTMGSRSSKGDTVTGAVRLALDITESLSDGVPFLPGAVKALRTVVEACDVRRSHSRACSSPSGDF